MLVAEIAALEKRLTYVANLALFGVVVWGMDRHFKAPPRSSPPTTQASRKLRRCLAGPPDRW